MRRSSLLALLAVVGFAAGGAAYVRSLYPTSSGLTTLSWPAAGPVIYELHAGIAAGPANVEAGSDPVAAIDAAFQTLGAATGLNFVNGGNGGSAEVALDGINTVTFAATPGNVATVGGALAVTTYWFSSASGAIVEADVVFNPAMSFTTLGTASLNDVQAVATHEAGHAVGLDHSLMIDATMEPLIGAGSTNARTLSADDLAGLAGLYPAAAPARTGTLAGTVQRGPGQPVAGAHLVARDAITGRTRVGGLSRPDGSFAIDGLAPGLYELWAQPLIGNHAPGNVTSSGWSPGSFDVNFATDVLGGVGAPTPLVVQADLTTTAPTLTVGGPAPTLYVAATFPMATPTGGFSVSFAEPVLVAPGASLWMGVVGPGFHTLPDSAFTFASPFVALSGPSTQSGSLGSLGYKILPLSVAADAPVGGYPLRVTAPGTGETAIAPGTLEVVTPTPAAWALGYGAGCPGVGGPVALAAPSPPALGNLGFTLEASGTLPGEAVFFVLSRNPDDLVVAPGCVVHVDLATLVPPFDQTPVPATGSTTTLAIPLPVIPSLAGRDLFVQVAAIDAAMGLLRLSNGLALHLE